MAFTTLEFDGQYCRTAHDGSVDPTAEAWDVEFEEDHPLETREGGAKDVDLLLPRLPLLSLYG